MGTIVNPRWDDRRDFILSKWPLFTEKDLHTLERHPENIIIKLQKLYHYSKMQAYDAYFELMETDENPTVTSRILG